MKNFYALPYILLNSSFFFFCISSAFNKAADEIIAVPCVVTVPYKWFSRNPFRSTYFACLSMAAEMSTGVLAMGHSYGQNPPLSMLVLKVEGTFSKKATGITTFTCDEGKRIAMAIKETVSSGKSVSVTVRAVGKNKIDELVADFYLTWSFKVKAHKNK